MDRRGVLVKDGVVLNTIVWGDSTDEQMSHENLDHYEETTGWSTQPGIGWTYTESDGYRPPKPFPSWSWNNDTWKAPVEKPTEGLHTWNEETKSWDLVPTEE
jgi:hypothetical protein